MNPFRCCCSSPGLGRRGSRTPGTPPVRPRLPGGEVSPLRPVPGTGRPAPGTRRPAPGTGRPALGPGTGRRKPNRYPPGGRYQMQGFPLRFPPSRKPGLPRRRGGRPCAVSRGRQHRAQRHRGVHIRPGTARLFRVRRPVPPRPRRTHRMPGGMPRISPTGEGFLGTPAGRDTEAEESTDVSGAAGTLNLSKETCRTGTGVEAVAGKRPRS